MVFIKWKHRGHIIWSAVVEWHRKWADSLPWQTCCVRKKEKEIKSSLHIKIYSICINRVFIGGLWFCIWCYQPVWNSLIIFSKKAYKLALFPLAPLRPCNLLKIFASYLLAVQCKYNLSIYCVLCCFISKVCRRSARGDKIQWGYNFWHNTARADTPRLVEAEQQANSMCISALPKNKYSLTPHSLTVLNLLHPISPVSLKKPSSSVRS